MLRIELKYVYMRWRYVIEDRKVRYREPHSARQHGHSVQVMLTMYGAWIECSTDEDIAAIKRGDVGTHDRRGSSEQSGPRSAPKTPPRVPLARAWRRLSWRKIKKYNGGADGTRTV